jgi:hypothetical protein
MAAASKKRIRSSRIRGTRHPLDAHSNCASVERLGACETPMLSGSHMGPIGPRVDGRGFPREPLLSMPVVTR